MYLQVESEYPSEHSKGTETFMGLVTHSTITLGKKMHFFNESSIPNLKCTSHERHFSFCRLGCHHVHFLSWLINWELCVRHSPGRSIQNLLFSNSKNEEGISTGGIIID